MGQLCCLVLCYLLNTSLTLIMKIHCAENRNGINHKQLV